MSIKDLHNKRVAILGFGQEGQAIARFLHANGINADIVEEKDPATWAAEAQEFIKESGMQVKSRQNYEQLFPNYQIIFRSPGFNRNHPALRIAEANGTDVTSQVRWFFEHCPARVVGVTGTKGKGTTCALTAEILKTAKAKGEILAQGNYYLTGNIGKDQPLDFLGKLTKDDLVVYELSSFQLQDLPVSPHIGVCLMVTSDHLDQHESLAEYHSAKEAITKFQTNLDITIYNGDYPATEKIGLLGGAQKYCITKNKRILSGAIINEDSITLYNVFPTETVLDCKVRKLRGAHNLENIAAASIASAKCGATAATIQDAIREFSGLEHRLQFIKAVNGVEFYNDSISTVPETAMAAIESFPGPVIPILGGSDKGLSYELLADFLATKNNIKAIAVIGQTGQTIKQLLSDRGFAKPIIDHGATFQEILTQVTQAAEPGDTVILSPASASFDMFKNYADRGHQFVQFVRDLK